MSTAQSGTQEGTELLDQLEKTLPVPNVILPIYTCPPPACKRVPVISHHINTWYRQCSTSAILVGAHVFYVCF